MSLPVAVTTIATSWSAYYSDHQLVSVFIRYLHIAATVVGGGKAIALDRQIVAARRADGDTRRSALRQLRGSHRIVVPALTIVLVTGLLMTAADLDTFLGSTLYWVKIAFVAALAVNGAVLLAAETAAERGEGGSSWKRLATVSVASMTLWLITLFVGTWLTVGA